MLRLRAAKVAQVLIAMKDRELEDLKKSGGTTMTDIVSYEAAVTEAAKAPLAPVCARLQFAVMR